MGRSIRTKEYADFVGKLCDARHDSGLSQVQVAKKLKRPQSYISKAESGEQRLDVIELKAFARIYKKDIGFFIQ
ncbi:MAG: helix-turn-helix transcriptional regulator [Candidatus Pacebacteria bacterium]|nr:helix-turn-helix transcriptional regulator [Candidatus Paceibacterota bacterium]